MPEYLSELDSNTCNIRPICNLLLLKRTWPSIFNTDAIIFTLTICLVAGRRKQYFVCGSCDGIHMMGSSTTSGYYRICERVLAHGLHLDHGKHQEKYHDDLTDDEEL